MPNSQNRFSYIPILIGLFLTAVGPTFGQQGAIRQKALELRNPLVVLTMALQPGDEDFDILEELRSERGILFTSAYLTNGESGESDLGSSYPNELGALRREEATQAVEAMGGRAYFLNIPSPGAVKDSAGLWSLWDRDSVRIRIARMLSSIRPHLVIFFAERFPDKPSIPWLESKDQLRLSILMLKQPKSLKELQLQAGLPVWEVQRAVAGKKIPGTPRKQKPQSRNSGRYPSMAQQFRLFAPFSAIDYSEHLTPARSKKTKRIDDGLPLRVSGGLKNLNDRIGNITRDILNSKRLNSARKRSHLEEITAIADSVDYLIGLRYSAFRGPDQKMLLLWKEGLQDLKNELLGVSVSYFLADSILTSMQVTTLTIDSVQGASARGQRWFFFPPAREGWIINESMKNRFPLSGRTLFRIVSPGSLIFNIPAQQEGLETNSLYTPIDCFIVQSDSDRTNSFGFRLRLPFRFAPKFTVEVLTPIVRAVDGEKVVVRTTNHSNDGVSDRIGVSDSIVTSSVAPFRLSKKESSQTDTLTLQWKGPPSQGDHLLHVEITDIDVANFAARAFEANIGEEDLAIGLIAADGQSAVHESLRRLGVTSERRRVEAVTVEWLSSRDVIILDHRIYSRDSSIVRLKEPLLERAKTGGHVIVLSQDAPAWNANPLIKGLLLRQRRELEPDLEIHARDGERLISFPNELSSDDWNGWMFSRAANEVTVPRSAETLLSIGEVRIPGVVRAKVGRGKITFVNLNLPTQWLNIHPGSFRLLANLLAD